MPLADMAASIDSNVDAMDCEADFGPHQDLEMSDSSSYTSDVESDGTSFLDLPYDVRLQIYIYADLVRPCPIDVADEKHRQKGHGNSCLKNIRDSYQDGDWNTACYLQVCDHPAIPVNLFRVSQAVFEDAVTVFWSQNRFQLNLRNLDDLVKFKNAVGAFHECLQCVHVSLRCYDGRILKPNSRAKSTFNLWNKFCSLVVRHMPMLKFFSFDCRVGDAETAERLISGMSPFHTLSHCALRFDFSARSDLQEIATKAATQATMTPCSSSTPFPFMDLPGEIQLMVLKHLLVAQWDPFVQNPDSAGGMLVWQSRKEVRPRVLYCCGTCSPNLRNCFCSLRQNAFSTTCSCFVSPLPYFLVNRHMYTLGREVFYTRNRFSFLGDDPRAMFRFLHCLPADSLSMIRDVTFAFPKAQRYVVRVDQQYYDNVLMDWSILIRFIAEHFRLELLSVNVVDMGSTTLLSDGSGAWTKFIRDVLKGFSPLQGVQQFQVYLAEDRGYETRAERAIMGRKYEPPQVKHVPFVGTKQKR